MPARAEPPRTVAETSDYKATSRHADVLDFCERLAKESPLVRLGTLGTSQEGRKLPLLIVADPPVATPAEAHKSKKLVVFAMGDIHAGEVDGKEALLMLARDLATAKERPLLKDLVLVFAPIFNADGNEKIAKDNRPEQAGPAEGVGMRANAQGFDLNRDFVKLESPEVRALVRFFNQWDPAVFIDCHTTNGSFHRYTITYEGGRCPAGDPRIVAEVRDAAAARRRHGVWRKRPATDRTSTASSRPTAPSGRRCRPRRATAPSTSACAIASPSCPSRTTYAPFKDRVLASRAFVKAICEDAAENKDKLAKLLSRWPRRHDPGRQGAEADRHGSCCAPKPVPHRPAASAARLRGGGQGRQARLDRRAEGIRGPVRRRCRADALERRPGRMPTFSRPTLGTPSWRTLQRHGITVEELREDIELDVEVYRIDR